MGSDATQGLTSDMVVISIHAPAWGATVPSTSSSSPNVFQSTLPHGERPPARMSLCCSVRRFQSTLPHGERHGCRQLHLSLTPISIHAPAWGATSDGHRHPGHLRISIHAPAWGATTAPYAEGSSTTDFNPRSRMGSDDLRGVKISCLDISIHAPAWGATTPDLSTLSSLGIFQSTLPHGERLGAGGELARRLDISIHAPAWGATHVTPSMMMDPGVFQSTLPHGERHWAHVDGSDNPYFNPRSRMGSDGYGRYLHPEGDWISIHAPAWGATATTDSIFRYVDDIIRYCEQCAAAVAY